MFAGSSLGALGHADIFSAATQMMPQASILDQDFDLGALPAYLGDPPFENIALIANSAPRAFRHLHYTRSRQERA